MLSLPTYIRLAKEMKTRLIELTSSNTEHALSEASLVIKSGGLVVFPTETVYGLGADATNEEALKKIFVAKGRPSDNPIIVHIANISELSKLTDEVSIIESKLIEKFWPGPLTFIFNKKNFVPAVLSGGLETVAVRMPAHPFAHELLLRAGVPIGAPSANTSGRPSGTTGAHALDDLMGKVDLIIDGGSSEIGVESTVVRVLDKKILILRAGSVTREMIQDSIPESEVDFALDKKDLDASPGTRYRHYAPNARLEIISGDMALRKVELEKEGKKVGIICSNANKDLFSPDEKVFILGDRGDLGEISKNLYQALRYFDAHLVDVVLCESFPEDGLGKAIMDRLKKASNA